MNILNDNKILQLIKDGTITTDSDSNQNHVIRNGILLEHQKKVLEIG